MMNAVFSRLTPAVESAVNAVAVREDRPVSATLRLLIKEALAARGALPDDRADTVRLRPR